ncbi:MAG: hypothetical protein ABMB14_00610 [Myxococcota bacterium]
MARIWLVPVMLVGGCLASDARDLPSDLTIDGRTLEVRGGSGEVVADEIRLVAIVDPDCAVMDDEQQFALTIRLLDRSAIELGAPIDLSDPEAPVALSLAVACFCDRSSGRAERAVWGTLTLDALDTHTASGSLDLDWLGDVPFDSPGEIAFPDAELHLAWSFDLPFDHPTCRL